MLLFAEALRAAAKPVTYTVALKIINLDLVLAVVGWNTSIVVASRWFGNGWKFLAWLLLWLRLIF